MPIPLLVAVIIAAMVGWVAYLLLARASWAARVTVMLVIALVVFIVEMVAFGVSGA